MALVVPGGHVFGRVLPAQDTGSVDVFLEALEHAAPGDVLDDRLTIACGAGAIRILDLQRAGKPPMKAEAFLNGTPLKPPARVS